MTTPKNEFNYNSPYVNSLKQYPSQSEDYISLDMGGPIQHASSSNEKTPGNNMKYYQQNYRNSNCKANRTNLFNNSHSQQKSGQSFNRQQRYSPNNSNEWYQRPNVRNSNEKKFHDKKYHGSDKKDKTNIASYCHASMTEDPWFHLMQRITSLQKSEISAKETSPKLDSNSNSNSDNDDEVVGSPTKDCRF